MIATPLPVHAHIPGRNARHPSGHFNAWRDQAISPTRSDTAADNIAFQAGLDLLEAGFYWEAHEVLEPVWMNAPANTPERFLVQALIQLANAALKQVMDRPRAAHRLCAIARGLLARAASAGAIVMGLEIATIATQIERLDRAIETSVRLSLRVRPPG